MDIEVRSSSLDFTEIAQLADQGMVFVGCKIGMSSSRWLDWQDRATTNKFMLLDWIKAGNSLVTVTKRGHSFVLDIDDQAECERLGFKREWLDGYYPVATPSGGEHHHGLHDVLSETLANVINVYRVKGNPKSGKILELKLHNQSVAAPTAERFADEKKCAGIYEPRMRGAQMRRGIDPELVLWLEKHGEPSTPHEKSSASRIDFHPQHEMERFLECHDCTEDQSGTVDGALHVVVESCPICGKDARDSTVAAGITKFIFGGYSFGFVCHACGVNTKEELQEKLTELVDGFEPWNEFIYKDDDPEFLLSSFGAEEASAAEETEIAEEVSASTPPRIFPLTDMGNAERLAFRYAGKFTHTEATGWMVYEGGVWKRDKTGAVVRAMHKTVRLITKETELVNTQNEEVEKKKNEEPDEADKKKKAEIIAWGIESESSAKIKAALEQASALQVFAKDYADFDQQPDMLNVANGTIDLKTFQFMRHDPKHLLTKKTPINYRPDADCPKGEQFILDIMDGKTHMRDYLQRCCGYTLTADTSGQCFFMPWGTGGTGKSTMLRVMAGIMGTYCRQADSEMFMVKRGDAGQPFEMAGMEGVRLLMAVETEEGKKLAIAKLKRMTGQDSITACYKFKQQYEFIPQWKVWLATNDAPTTRAEDDAFWDRAKPIPFEVKFRNSGKEIKDYADILLREEGSGILNWCLEGLKQYREKGLAHPEDVAQKADEWRDRDDWLARFIEDIGLEPTDDKQRFVTKHDLWLAFSSWADVTKQAKGVDEKRFTQAMRRKGYEDEKPIKRDGKTVRVWHNVRIPTLGERGSERTSDLKDVF
jgi:putative DNA primase/helicase